MGAVAGHPHNFSPSEWRFADAPNTTIRLMRDGCLILLVCHDIDGDCQVLSGTMSDTADGRVVCLGCVFESDRSIDAVGYVDRLTGLEQGAFKWLPVKREKPCDISNLERDAI